MSDPTQKYLLCLARLNEDGTIHEPFLKDAVSSFPQVSSDAPLDEETARSLLRAAADRIDGVREFLQAVAEVLPSSEEQEAMFDDQIPMTSVVNMAMAVDSVVRDFLGPPPALLRRTSALTDGDLQRDFDESCAGSGVRELGRIGR